MMFGLLNALVELGLLAGVEVCFLPVGHTHEEIDGVFGNIANHVTCINVLIISRSR